MKKEDFKFDVIDFICLFLIPIIFVFMLEYGIGSSFSIKADICILVFYSVAYLTLRTMYDKADQKNNQSENHERLLCLYKLNK